MLVAADPALTTPRVPQAEYEMFEFLILLLFPGAMAFAACSDLVSMTISNRISLLLLAAFLIMAPWAGMDLPTMGQHVAAGAAMLVVGFAMFAAGWIGGGDAKLFAATSLWLGWQHLLDYTLAVAFLGGGLTLAIVLLRAQPWAAAATGRAWMSWLHDERGDIPYGVALAAAALIVYPQTAWMTPVG